MLTWGNNVGGDGSTVQTALIGVEKIYSTDYAFDAVLKDGTSVTGGVKDYGGDSSTEQAMLIGVDTI